MQRVHGGGVCVCERVFVCQNKRKCGRGEGDSEGDREGVGGWRGRATGRRAERGDGGGGSESLIG